MGKLFALCSGSSNFCFSKKEKNLFLESKQGIIIQFGTNVTIFLVAPKVEIQRLFLGGLLAFIAI